MHQDLDILDTYDEGGFWGNIRPTIESGEQRLVLAMIEDAVRCYVNHKGSIKPHQRRLWFDAREWIYGDIDSDMTFEYACNQVGIEPEYLRRKLREPRGRVTKRRHPRVSGSRHQIRAA